MTTPQPALATPLYGPQFQQKSADLYAELRRAHGPVAPVLLDGDLPAWLVLGYREVQYVVTNPEVFGRDSRRWNAWDRVPPDWPLLPLIGYQPTMMFAEGAEHRRRAEALDEALGAVDQFDLGARAQQVADELIDAFAGSGEADLITQYADGIPLPVVARMIGVPDAETGDLVRDVYRTHAAGEGANEAYARVREKVRRMVEAKRRDPGPDVTSRLLAHPAALADEEITEDLLHLMNAGQLPTAYWIGNTLRLMLTDDRFAMTLSGGRRSVGQALNEVLWEDTPTQNFPGRFAVHDLRLGGRQIRKGDLLILGLAAANQDPLVRPVPQASTGNQAYMSFSHGEHRCPYAAQEIAKVIAEAAIEVLLDRLPDVVLAVPADTLAWRPSPLFRGLAALPVKFTLAW
ncbi:cytochrome P450 [Amycolatopsis mediterranei S699]|uniref:Cytochrome P450 n=2 Tax=Amycolatopsis mediterranei TaxID=33910 RepID=A0A0H3CY47_AMYMU|nr:cytochrome P450 [Amycolatopsis mediterranei]ADJ43248.1 cytochrome P450 [Amycolatopsis mediterranei U32]AEK39946.1 cytochrome P450 [Amycolatopsis mediterranei S699]AFO74961.1 cytochrome P450 [Amycolatopsis mediterranei S699]AGT82090.1 cytochrome P450 [Amycolatopsis mediterranei RB]KDO05160.1 cytochrome P450 [Amycolatopsis mediterranei]